MDSSLVFVKTPLGEEAVRNSSRIVQRSMRMVLVLIDGKLTVGELSGRVGNPALVESAVVELERSGFIVPVGEGGAALPAAMAMNLGDVPDDSSSALSRFSVFDPSGAPPAKEPHFSSFGKPILPAVEPVQPPAAVPSASGFVDWRRSRLVQLGGALCLLLGLALFYPWDLHRKAVEAGAAQALGVPVKIAQLSGVWLPRPMLELRGVELGATAESSVRRVRLPLSAGWLTGGGARIVQLEILEAEISTGHLLRWLGGADQGIALAGLREIGVESLDIRAGQHLLGRWQGRLLMSGGRLENARLESVDRALSLVVLPGTAGSLTLTFEGRAWRPESLDAALAGLQAKAVLRAEQLEFSSFDAGFSGGAVSGRGVLTWSPELQLQGNARFSALDLGPLTAGLLHGLPLEGEFSGEATLEARGADWSPLWAAARWSAQGEVRRGRLVGIDLGEAARQGVGSQVHGGQTRFDRLQLRIERSAMRWQLRDMALDAGLMTARLGADMAPDGQLTAQGSITMHGSGPTLNLPFRATGKAPNFEVSVLK